MDNKTRRHLRQIAHHLDPVVSLGDAGVSDAVVAEAERALSDHELIKVKIHAESRVDRQSLAEALARHCRALIVQKIGKVIVLYRESPEPNPRLSNLLRFKA